MRRRKRPVSALLMTMGIIGIAGGVLGLLCGLCGVAGQAILLSSGAGAMQGDYFRYLDREAPLARVAEMAKPISLLLLSPLLIAGSAATLTRKSGGRWVVLVYALLLVPIQLFHAIYELAVVVPATERFFRMQANAGGPAAAAVTNQMLATKVGIVVALVVWLMLSLAMVVGLFNPVASRELAPAPPPRRDPFVDDEDDFDDRDEDDDRPRRRRPRDDDDYE